MNKYLNFFLEKRVLINNKLGLVNERIVFYSVLLINVIVLWSLKYYSSMDGPAHLYNSNLISHLIKGDISSLSIFFTFNTIPIPNWTSHSILSILCLIFPSWIAEKIMLSFYIIGLALSFRLLISKIAPSNISLSILIFPFIYSFLFHLGFYNFCLSFILFFYTIFYWIKSKDNNYIRYIYLSILITLTYFSNVLIYGFLGISLAFLVVLFEIRGSKFFSKENIRIVFNKLLLLFVISIPSLVCLSLFYTTTKFFNSTDKLSANELFNWIKDVRPLIVYNYQNEAIITRLFLLIIIGIVSISLYNRFQSTPLKEFYLKIEKNDIFLFISFIALFLFFTVPNGSNAGMMSDRYCLIFYMVLIIWVVAQLIPTRLRHIFIGGILVLHSVLLFQHYKVLKNLNKDAQTIESASKYLEKGSVVYSINMSDNWLETNFSNYLGVEKAIVLLQNYEANVGWFPLKWNTDSLPHIVFGNKIDETGINWTVNNNSNKIINIDYVLVYGTLSKMENDNYTETKKLLDSNYKLVYESNDKFVVLYKFIKNKL